MSEIAEHPVQRDKINLIWIGVGLGISYWLFESIRGSLVYPQMNIFEGMFTPGSGVLWMRLLVVCMIILFSFLARHLLIKSTDWEKAQNKKANMFEIVLAGVGFGALYWVLESVRGFYPSGESGLSAGIFAPGSEGLWMRLLAVAMLFLLSLYAQSQINKVRRSEGNLKGVPEIASEELAGMVIERTDELSEETTRLSEANARLKKEIAEIKKEGEELHRLNRVQKTLNECRLQIIRAEQDPDLLDKVCDALVDEGNYCFVWVGLAEKDADNKQEEIVRPACSKGRGDGYLDTLTVTLEDTSLDPNPVSETLRTGKAYIEKDLFNSYNNTPWRAEATKRGFASMICLPLAADEATFGVINLFAQEPAAFSDSEVNLLIALADDLASGVAASKGQGRSVKEDK